MATFAESIAEDFHSEVDLNWRLESVRHATASFTVRTITVEVDFEQREDRGPRHVAFNTVRADMTDRSNVMLAFRIFNGVFQAVEPELLVLSRRMRIWRRSIRPT